VVTAIKEKSSSLAPDADKQLELSQGEANQPKSSQSPAPVEDKQLKPSQSETDRQVHIKAYKLISS